MKEQQNWKLGKKYTHTGKWKSRKMRRKGKENNEECAESATLAATPAELETEKSCVRVCVCPLDLVWFQLQLWLKRNEMKWKLKWKCRLNSNWNSFNVRWGDWQRVVDQVWVFFGFWFGILYAYTLAEGIFTLVRSLQRALGGSSDLRKCRYSESGRTEKAK